jgi:hypothetical protein
LRVTARDPVYDIVWLRDRHRFLNTVLARRREWRRTASANESALADVA